MAGYTGNVFGTRVLAWGTINLDNFLIGRFVGRGSSSGLRDGVLG